MKRPKALDAISLEEARVLMDTTLGRASADLVIANARVVNVYTREIFDGQSICTKGRWIAYVGSEAEACIGSDTTVIDAKGKTVIPGLIDGHTHLGQHSTPDGFINYILKSGTTSLVTEMMEPHFAAGMDGILDFLAAVEDQPIKVFCTAPAGVSISRVFRSIKREDLHALIGKPEIVGLGESFWQAVLQEPDVYLPSFLDVRTAAKAIEGHSAGAGGRKLVAYAAAGVTSCHEAITLQEALERLRLGLNVMLREGAVRKDLEAFVGIKDLGIDLRRVSIITDSVTPDELVASGYLETALQKVIDLGLDPVTAIQMVTLNVATHFNLDRLIGGLAPGLYADMLIVPDVGTIWPEVVISNGVVVARDGEILVPARRHSFSEDSLHTVNLPRRVAPEDFLIRSTVQEGTVEVRVIEMVTDLVTAERSLNLPVRKGAILCDQTRDIVKIAAVDRRLTPGKTFCGFIKGFRMARGAMASSFAWDSTDIVVVGADEEDMAAAVNRIAEMQGGFVVCCGGIVLNELALPVFGVMSMDPIEEVAAKLQSMRGTARELGVLLPQPFMSLNILTAAAIPYLRICDEGLVNLKDGRTVGLFPD